MTKILLLLTVIISVNGTTMESILKLHKKFVLKGSLPEAIYIKSNITAYGLSGMGESWYIYPDKYYTKIDLGIMSQVEVFDGKTPYSIDRNGKLEYKKSKSDFDKSYLSAVMSSFGYLNPNKFNLKLKDYGEDIIEGVSYYKVGYSYGSSKEVIHCYNLESGALEIVKSKEMGIAVTEARGEFNQYGSVKIPKTIDVALAIGMGSMRSKNIEISTTKKVPDDLFVLDSGSDRDFSFLKGKSFSKSKIKILNGHIFIKAKINNLGYRYFIFDTGAMTTVVDKKLIDDMGLKIDGVLPSVGAGGHNSTSLTKIDSLRLGSLHFDAHTIAVMDFSSMQPFFPMKINGLLGYDLVSRVVTKIDYENSEMTFYDPETFKAPKGYREVEIFLNNKLILVEMKVNGIKGRFYLDTGSNAGVNISKKFSERSGLDRRDGKISSVMGIGGSEPITVLDGVPVQFGGKSHNVEVSIHKKSSGVFAMEDVDGIVGSKLFGSNSIITNYGDRVIYLEE